MRLVIRIQEEIWRHLRAVGNGVFDSPLLQPAFEPDAHERGNDLAADVVVPLDDSRHVAETEGDLRQRFLQRLEMAFKRAHRFEETPSSCLESCT